MIIEAFGIGDTYEQAQEAAKAELNAGPEADIQFEIIDMPKKKVLGVFGGTKAKVRAYVELPDEKPAKSVKPRTEKANKPSKTNKSEKPAKQEKKESVAVSKTASKEFADTVDYTTLEQTEPAYKACEYLKKILEQLGCGDIVIKTAPIHNGCFIDLNGTNLGTVIGRRGETLDALQYLSSLAANSKESGYFRVVLNIGNYREKRESTLQGLARRTASQCLRTGRSRTLEPMNPYERRIIHTTIQDMEGVSSNSIGEGASRRVVITPDRATRSADAKPASTQADSRPVKKDAKDLPLYGKIN